MDAHGAHRPGLGRLIAEATSRPLRFAGATRITWLAKLKRSLKAAGHKRDRKVADLKQMLKKLSLCMFAADVRRTALCFQVLGVL